MFASVVRGRGAVFALSLAALLLALGAGELGFRFLRSRGLLPGMQPLVAETDPVLGWRYAAGQRVHLRTAEFDVDVELDGVGDRRGFGAARGPLAVFLGDSLTFGWGVRAQEAFPFRVGRDLGLRVADLGVPGYGPDQELLRLRRDGLPRHPDLVVLALCDNDLDDVARTRAFGRGKPVFELRGASLLLRPARPPSWLAAHSQLWRAFRGHAEEEIRGPASGSASRVRLVQALVDAAAAEAGRAGARFVLVRSAGGWQQSISARRGALLVDVAPALAADERPTRFPVDGHWNAEGHRVAAVQIERALLKDGDTLASRRL